MQFIKECLYSVIYDYSYDCVLCGESTSNAYLCDNCKKSLKFYNEKFYLKDDKNKFTCFSVCYYSYGMLKLILKLKYESNFKAGRIISDLMVKKIIKEDIPVDIIAYVPSSYKNFKKRGFNQSKVLAKNISLKIHKPLYEGLKRKNETKDQIQLNKKDRWNNMKDCFYLSNKSKIVHKKILLVDDVITTGATAFSCANILFKNNKNEINILTAGKSDV